MKQITKKTGVLLLFALLLSIIVPTTDVKASTYEGRTITFNGTATYTNIDKKLVAFSEVVGNYKFVYSVNMLSFGANKDFITCHLMNVAIYKKQGSSWVKASKGDTVDVLEIPEFISAPNATFVQYYGDDDLRTRTLSVHKIRLLTDIDIKDDYDSSNDTSFFTNSFDCTVNTLIIPFGYDTSFQLKDNWFNGFNGHIGTIVLAGTETNSAEEYPSTLWNYIDYYAIKETKIEVFQENVKNGDMTLEDCKKYFEEYNFVDYYNNVFLTGKDPKRADFDSALKGSYKEYQSVANIELTETPKTSAIDGSLASGYGTFSNLDSTKKEYLTVLSDTSYCLYAKNNKDNIVRYELVLENGSITIADIRVFQNTEDYLEEKEFEKTENQTSLGNTVIPSTITINKKSYNVTKTSGVCWVSGYYLDNLTISNTVEEVVTLQGYDDFLFTQIPVKTLNISKGLKTVCPYFLNNITNVKLSADNPYLSYTNGFLYSKDYKTLYGTVAKKIRNVVIKSTVQTIEKNALSLLNIYQGGTITFPSSLKTIKSQENWRNENGSIIVSKRDYTIQFKGATPPEIESFPMLKNYYILTPNTSSAINSYNVLKDKNGDKVFSSDYIVTKHYYKNLSVLTKLQKDSKKLTAKPSEVSASDWKYIVSKAKAITKGCKNDTERLNAIDTYIRNLTLNEDVNERRSETIYGAYDYVALIKKKQVYGNSSYGLFALLTKAVGIASVQTCTLNTDMFSTYSYDTAVLLDGKTWTFFRFDGSDKDYNINCMVNSLKFFTQECGYGDKIGTLITVYDEFK